MPCYSCHVVYFKLHCRGVINMQSEYTWMRYMDNHSLGGIVGTLMGNPVVKKRSIATLESN